jgi:flagellar biogenesis protein FliO
VLAAEPAAASAVADDPPQLEPWRVVPEAETLTATPEPVAPSRADPLLQPKPDPTEAPPGEELGLGWTLLRTAFVLGMVILAVYVTLNFGLRRLLGIAAMPRGPGVVQVVERIPLDQKRAMFVIKAAGEYLLIGSGDGALTLISKLDTAEVEKAKQAQPPSGLALSPLLQKLLKRRDAPEPPAASGDPS